MECTTARELLNGLQISLCIYTSNACNLVSPCFHEVNSVRNPVRMLHSTAISCVVWLEQVAAKLEDIPGHNRAIMDPRPERDYGDSIRDRHRFQAARTDADFMLFMNDDDLYAPNAFDAVRQVRCCAVGVVL